MEVPFPFSVPYVRWADVANLSPATPMPPRLIYDHELIYVLGGSGEIIINGVASTASEDRLFLILPRDWHAFRATTKKWSLLGVHFDWESQKDTLTFSVHRAATDDASTDNTLFRKPLRVAGWHCTSVPFLALKKRPVVRRLLEEVVATYSTSTDANRDENGRLAAGALLAATLIQIGREACDLETEASCLPFGADALRRVNRARKLLEDSDVRLSIEEIAASVDWSGDHLRRVCRSTLHRSPQELRTSARIRRARELLRAGEMPIYAIAANCGFIDPSHFSRVFKAETGLSPRQFLAMAKR